MTDSETPLAASQKLLDYITSTGRTQPNASAYAGAGMSDDNDGDAGARAQAGAAAPVEGPAQRKIAAQAALAARSAQSTQAAQPGGSASGDAARGEYGERTERFLGSVADYAGVTGTKTAYAILGAHASPRPGRGGEPSEGAQDARSAQGASGAQNGQAAGGRPAGSAAVPHSAQIDSVADAVGDSISGAWFSSGLEEAVPGSIRMSDAEIEADRASRASLLTRMRKGLVQASSNFFASGRFPAVRDRIAVSFGLGGMMLAHAAYTPDPIIEDVRFFPLSADAMSDQDRMLAEAGRIIRNYLATNVRAVGARLNMYLPSGIPMQDFVFDLADDIPAERIDQVAVLTALEQKRFDAAACYFDYRPIRRMNRDQRPGEPTRYFALAVQRKEVDAYEAKVLEAGIPVTGLTAMSYAATSFLTSGWLPRPGWSNYISVFVGEEMTVVVLLVDGLTAIRRKLNFGVADMLEQIESAYGDSSALSFLVTNTGSPLAARTEEERSRLYLQNLSQSDFLDLRAKLADGTERIDSFVNRVANYHLFSQGGPAPEGTYILAPNTIARLLAERLSETRGGAMKCVSGRLDDGAMREHAREIVHDLLKRGYGGLVRDAIGLSLAANAVPNMLNRPDQRRREAAEMRRASAVGAAMTAAAIAAMLFCGANVWKLWMLHGEISRLESLLPAASELLTSQNARDELARLRELQSGVETRIRRRDLALVLAELVDLKMDGVYFTEVSLESANAIVSKEGKTPSEFAEAAAAANAKGLPRLTIKGVVTGGKTLRDTRLTELMQMIRRNPNFGGVPVLVLGPTGDKSMGFTLTLRRAR